MSQCVSVEATCRQCVSIEATCRQCVSIEATSPVKRVRVCVPARAAHGGGGGAAAAGQHQEAGHEGAWTRGLVTEARGACGCT